MKGRRKQRTERETEGQGIGRRVPALPAAELPTVLCDIKSRELDGDWSLFPWWHTPALWLNYEWTVSHAFWHHAAIGSDRSKAVTLGNHPEGGQRSWWRFINLRRTGVLGCCGIHGDVPLVVHGNWALVVQVKPGEQIMMDILPIINKCIY